MIWPQRFASPHPSEVSVAGYSEQATDFARAYLIGWLVSRLVIGCIG